MSEKAEPPAAPGEASRGQGSEGGEELLIVPADAADAAAAAEITREAFRGVSIDQAVEQLIGPTAGMSWQEIKANEVRREIARSPRDCFVAKVGGKVVGYVTTHCDRVLLRGEIPNLAVDRRHRGRGIGRKLLNRALEHFRRAGMKQAKIETLQTNPVGQHLYPAVGFREVARQIHYVMALE